MQAIQMFVRRNFTTLLLLMPAAAFVTLLAELLLTGHVGGIRNVADITSAAGLVAVVVGLFARGTLRVSLAVVLVLLSFAGVIGTFEHFDVAGGEGEGARPSLAAVQENQQVAFNAQEEEGESEGPGGEGSESVPPPLAPLSLAGLAVMGAIVLLGRGEAVEVRA